MVQDIDYVLTYADFTKKEIIDLYESVSGKKINSCTDNNYIDLTLLLKLILKNLPFINHIFITHKDVQKLPSETEELISEMNGKIISVNESEFMPGNYTTFSSGCIEMFLWRIPGLSEYFIYANDDMLPLKKLKKEYFFINKTPIMKFNFGSVPMSCLYDLHCLNSTNLIFNRTDNIDNYTSICQTEHSFRPIRKSICQKCFDEYENFIMSSLYPVRFYNNFNFNLFMLYALKNGMVESVKEMPYTFKFCHATLSEVTIYDRYIKDGIFENVEDVICFNDPGSSFGDNSEEIVGKMRNIMSKCLEIY